MNLSAKIPLQNKLALSHYVARRKLIIEMMGLALRSDLIIQNDKKRRKNDEAILHNLILRKNTHNAIEDSNLWILNEDFIYFSGTSDTPLKDVKINGESIFDEDFVREEEAYLNSRGKKRLLRKPDILLFPDEGRCIIVEFKSPSEDVSEHLSQIDTYASLIRSYSKESFEFLHFYGYLIGENFETKDVMNASGLFKPSLNLDYLIRPVFTVTNHRNYSLPGNIYTEVLRYSTLLERARLRNSIFIDKLMGEDRK